MLFQSLSRLFLCCSLLALPLLATAQQEEAKNAPYFLVQSEQDGVLVSMPLVATSATVDIAGVIADVKIQQEYVNTGAVPIEAVYVFPASTTAAVYAQRMIVGDRIIEGVVQERGQARATYEAARQAGKRASLLEQQRPNVLQMEVANILPGDTIKVELNYTELLVPESGEYSFVYPTVVGPRYTGEGADDINYARQAYSSEGADPTYDFDLKLHLAAGMPIAELNSPTHRISYLPQEGNNALDIHLDPSERAGGQRDFVLRYRLGGDQIETGLLLFEGEEENFFLFMAQPPVQTSAEDYPPREFIFVLDVSGSMNGYPMAVTKELMRELIPQLRPQDRFNIMTFASSNEIWQEESRPATIEWLSAALNFVDARHGGGGTRLLSALQSGMALPRNTEGMSRSFVIVTDGYVSVEAQAFDLIRENLNQANFYTFGIGNSVNHHLIEGLAHVGRGQSFVVMGEAAAAEEASRFGRYISSPVLTQLELDFKQFDAYDVEPISLPDLTTERPLVVFGKYHGRPKGRLELAGYGGFLGLDNPRVIPANASEADYRHQSFNFQINRKQVSEQHAALPYLWARERLQRLSDYAGRGYGEDHKDEIVALGLRYNLLTQFTSFVAVEKDHVANPEGDLERVNQALPLPEGVSNMAVGFELGLSGISGLPTEEKAKRLLPLILVLVGLAGILFLLWQFRNRVSRYILPAVLLISLTACMPDKELPIDLPVEEAMENKDCGLAISSEQTITYILGEDSGTNAYYGRATDCFRYHPEWKSEWVVTNLRSLEAVVEDLRKYNLNSPWSRINLVVHGNQWTGLSAPARAGEDRANAQTIEALQAEINLLSSSVVTACTQVVLHGCSTGKDSSLLHELSGLFGNDRGEYPSVISSPNFSLFRHDEEGSIAELQLADYYFVAAPKGLWPSREELLNQLKTKYPDVQIDWRRALSRNRFSDGDAPCLYQFNVPVSWLDIYAINSDLPRLTGQTSMRQYANQIPRLRSELERLELRAEQFYWRATTSSYASSNDQSYPAIALEGEARVFCILQPLTGPAVLADYVQIRYQEGV